MAEQARPSYTLGLDLGELSDFTALAVLSSRERPTGGALHDVVHLQRWRGVKYPEIVAQVSATLRRPELRGRCQFVLDATGVGRPVAEMFQAVGEVSPCMVTITGGNAIGGSYPEFTVPKRDLVSVLVATAQDGRLRIAASLPDAAALGAEMLNFRVKLNKETGHDSYEAWREGDKDDLVLSVALAIWHAERFGSGTGVSFRDPREAEAETYWINRSGGFDPEKLRM